MSDSESPLKPIEPRAPRWEPTPDPNDIVIPGLDTTAPANEQIEQIEQIITMKLQNIDANFTKIQQIMTNRILPAVKRYAVGTEPVREAAKFWTVFFEQSAQIRVPTYEDYGVHNEEQTETEAEASTSQEPSHAESSRATTPTQDSLLDRHRVSTDISFMPGQAAISSTPAVTSQHRSQRSQEGLSQVSDSTPSWTASLESPLVRLDREIQSLGQDDAVSVASSSLADLTIRDEPSVDEDVTQRPVQTQDDTFHQKSEKPKGKGKEPAQPLLRNVLQWNASSSDTSNVTGHSGISPLKLRQKTSALKKLNPYLPLETNPADWSGLVDLKDPSVRSPSKPLPSPAKHERFTFHPPSSTSTNPSFKRPATPRPAKVYDDSDDSFDATFGMSPPLTMDFPRPPKLGKTPKKEAAERIMNKLLDVERRGAFGTGRTTAESSMSSMSSLPSLPRYTRPVESSSSVADASLESLMRRVGTGFDDGQPRESGVPSVPSSTSSYRGYKNPEITAQPSLSSSSHSHSTFTGKLQASASTVPRTPTFSQFDLRHLKDDELQPPDEMGDSSIDSLDDEELNNTANPSAAFILASNRPSFDDSDSSFESNQDSMDADDILANNAPIHPFARAQMQLSAEDDDGFDDSFDDPVYDQQDIETTEEETLFGVPPAQRAQIQAQQEERRQLQQQQQQFRMRGEHLLEDTRGIGAQRASAGYVEETPTPWVGERGA